MTQQDRDNHESVDQAEIVTESIAEQASGIPSLEGLFEAVKSEKEKALRAMAELENFKKRKDQEVEMFKKFAHERLIQSLLPIMDSFDRACDYLGEDVPEKFKGFLLIQKQFYDTLEKFGVSAIACVDQPFDPNMHQAVMEESVEGKEAGVVIRDMQKGYKLHDRVIRPSMTVVSK